MSNLTNKIRHKDLSGVIQSIRGGADLSRTDRNGNTPLHVAAEVDVVSIAHELIGAGAPLNTKNSEGKTPSEVKPGTETAANILNAVMSVTLLNTDKVRRRVRL